MPKKLAPTEVASVRDASRQIIQAQQFNDALARIINQLREEDDAWINDASLRLEPGPYQVRA
jgi:hypothetical protein